MNGQIEHITLGRYICRRHKKICSGPFSPILPTPSTYKLLLCFRRKHLRSQYEIPVRRGSVLRKISQLSTYSTLCSFQLSPLRTLLGKEIQKHTYTSLVHCNIHTSPSTLMKKG